MMSESSKTYVSVATCLTRQIGTMGCFTSKTKASPGPRVVQDANDGQEPANSSRQESNNSCRPSDVAEWWIVSSVYDGDTLRIRKKVGHQGEDVRLRLLGVDTPELKEREPYAEDAKQFLLRLIRGSRSDVRGTEVLLDAPQLGSQQDKYGRRLGILFIKDGSGFCCVNEALVAEGLARVYDPSSESGTPNAFVAALGRAQRRARAARRNIWSSVDEEATVYATRNGRAYHRRDCEHLHGGGAPMKTQAALDKMLSACRTCQP